MLRFLLILFMGLLLTANVSAQDFAVKIERSEVVKDAAYYKLKKLAESQSGAYWRGVLSDKKETLKMRGQAAEALYFYGDEKETIPTLLRHLGGVSFSIAFESMHTIVLLCPKDEKLLAVLVNILRFYKGKKEYPLKILTNKIFQAIGKYGKAARPHIPKLVPYLKDYDHCAYVSQTIKKIGIAEGHLDLLFRAQLKPIAKQSLLRSLLL